ncbi:hypothetical protein AB205_0143310, partial [Aquarana catesbeiana]
NSNGIYTGFIKVQMELRRPITVRARTHVQSHANGNGNNATFYLPKGSINILHISSTNTVREVIEALLKKFMWDAFTIPELHNFLRILDKEEEEQLQTLKRRYSSYKEKLEEALSGVHKPG